MFGSTATRVPSGYRAPRPHFNNAPLELVTEGYRRRRRVLTAHEMTVGATYPGRADLDDHLAVCWDRLGYCADAYRAELLEPQSTHKLPGTSARPSVASGLAEAARAVRRSSGRVPSRSLSVIAATIIDADRRSNAPAV